MRQYARVHELRAEGGQVLLVLPGTTETVDLCALADKPMLPPAAPEGVVQLNDATPDQEPGPAIR
jgi:hypothetical protein